MYPKEKYYLIKQLIYPMENHYLIKQLTYPKENQLSNQTMSYEQHKTNDLVVNSRRNSISVSTNKTDSSSIPTTEITDLILDGLNLMYTSTRDDEIFNEYTSHFTLNSELSNSVELKSDLIGNEDIFQESTYK